MSETVQTESTTKVQDSNTTKKIKQPSFMKSAFFGHLREDLIFPYPELGKEEKEEMDEFLKEIDKFCTENVDARKIDEEGKIPQEVLDGLAELGAMGLTTPEEYGGFGVSNTFFSAVMAIFAKHCSSLSVTMGAHLGIGSKVLKLFGTPEQQAKFYPKIASGEWLAAFCLTEPQAGSDAHSIRTTARLSEDGKHYVLNGEKIYITNGGIAHFYTVFAKIVDDNKEEKAFTAFALTRDMEGLKIGKEEKKMGLKGSSTTPIVFDNVKVPLDHVIGEPGKGFKVAMEILNTGRLSLASACSGGASEFIKHTAKYVKQRKQFGSTLSEFGLIQKKVARMAALGYAIESCSYLTARLADQEDVDFSLESAICKIFATESVWEMINETVQAFGGNGFITEYPYERILRDCRVNMIFEGTNEILKLFIALSALKDVGSHLKELQEALLKPLQSLGILGGYVSNQISKVFVKEKLTNISPEIAREASVVEKYTALLSQNAEKAIRMHRKNIIHQQLLLERFADMATDIYTLIACISRLDTQIKKGKKIEALTTEIECVRLYGHIAEERLRSTHQQLLDNGDTEIAAISKAICEKEGYPFNIWS